MCSFFKEKNLIKNSNPIIELENVFKTYYMGQNKKIAVHALNDVSLKIFPGEFVSIMGPSGSGKTTLLDVLSALLRPTSGSVFIKKEKVSGMRDSELAIVRGKTIGFIFQSFNLIGNLTAFENVMLPMWFRGISIDEREKKAKKLLTDVGLGDRLNHRPGELSGGQMQRVAIARALANDPEIIVADEPTGNLDSISGKQIMQTIKELNEKSGKTILMVTHDKNIGKFAKRQLNILDGKLV
jgi:putative ABC transport system ATP-binding protein